MNKYWFNILALFVAASCAPQQQETPNRHIVKRQDNCSLECPYIYYKVCATSDDGGEELAFKNLCVMKYYECILETSEFYFHIKLKDIFEIRILNFIFQNTLSLIVPMKMHMWLRIEIFFQKLYSTKLL